MAKTNEFEEGKVIGDKYSFSKEANIEYTYSSAEELVKDISKLEQMIQHHREHQYPRLKTLQEYYKGENTNILTGQRRREDHLADNRATHNFAEYVSGFIQGYMVGVPLKTSYPKKETDEQIRDINRINDADEHNSELVLDQSIYGRSYELVYRNRDDEIRFTTLDPLGTFVIYDNTVEKRPIAAVRYFSKQFNEDDRVAILYTENKIITYELSQAYQLKKKNEEFHYFEGVPIIECSNNKFRKGDFENVLPLIDLYDAAQSDTANYMQDLNDAMLKIVGNLDIDVEEAKRMKEANLLMLQTEVDGDGRATGADADYIYKKYDVAGTEAYKDRLFNNILLFTSIPNLLDTDGSTAQSGEAIKMKLFALAQKRATKERLFKRSLRDRYRLISNNMSFASEGNFDVNEISITFTENLPSMIDREMQWFNAAGGRLSQETMIENLPFVESAKEEMERIEKENELNSDMFQFPTEEETEKAD